MSDPDPLSDAKMWIRHAREDLQAGRQLLEEGSGVPRQSAWFAQQAAEKAPKALLIKSSPGRHLGGYGVFGLFLPRPTRGDSK